MAFMVCSPGKLSTQGISSLGDRNRDVDLEEGSCL